jgi:hypothetical protein
MAGIALNSDDEEIIEQVGTNVRGSPAHVATNSFANGSFDFSPGSHGEAPSTGVLFKEKCSFAT